MGIYIGEPPKSQEEKKQESKKEKQENPNTGFRKWWLDNQTKTIEKIFPRNGQPPFKVVAYLEKRDNRPHEPGKSDCRYCKIDEESCLTCRELPLHIETRDVKHDYYDHPCMAEDLIPFPKDAAALHSAMISMADKYVKSLETHLKAYEEEQERKRSLHRSAEQEEEEILHYADLGKWRVK